MMIPKWRWDGRGEEGVVGGWLSSSFSTDGQMQFPHFPLCVQFILPGCAACAASELVRTTRLQVYRRGQIWMRPGFFFFLLGLVHTCGF